MSTPYLRRGERSLGFYLAMCGHCFWESSLLPTWQQAKRVAVAHQRDATQRDRDAKRHGLNHPFYLYSGTAIRLASKESRTLSVPMTMRERSR